MALFRKLSWLTRTATDIWYQGYAEGYRDSHSDTMHYFGDRVIEEIHQDAVLSMTADVDTLERIVEIIEAVKEGGETQDD